MNAIANPVIKKWKHAHHNAEVVSVMEQTLTGDAETAVDYLLSRLTGHPGASKMFSDRQLRKLGNTLSHHAAKYAAMISAVYAKFDAEISATCPRAADFAPVFLKDSEAARKFSDSLILKREMSVIGGKKA
jgi:hypothetical protein